MKHLILISLIITSSAAQALPIKCKYTYQNQTYTGWIDSVSHTESISQQTHYTVANAHGFIKEPNPEAQQTTGISSFIKKNYTLFLLGADQIGQQAVLDYEQDIITTYHYQLKNIGYGIENGTRFIYFNLGNLIE